jgi:hypothetical protein
MLHGALLTNGLSKIMKLMLSVSSGDLDDLKELLGEQVSFSGSSRVPGGIEYSFNLKDGVSMKDAISLAKEAARKLASAYNKRFASAWITTIDSKITLVVILATNLVLVK